MENTTRYTSGINTNYYSGKIINIRYRIVLQTAFFLRSLGHAKEECLIISSGQNYLL